jgi:hypothetical protein
MPYSAVPCMAWVRICISTGLPVPEVAELADGVFAPA